MSSTVVLLEEDFPTQSGKDSDSGCMSVLRRATMRATLETNRYGQRDTVREIRSQDNSTDSAERSDVLALEDTVVGGSRITPSYVVLESARVIEIIKVLFASEQDDFPVLKDRVLVGMLSKRNILRTMASGNTQATVRQIMHPMLSVVEPDDQPLEPPLSPANRGGIRVE